MRHHCIDSTPATRATLRLAVAGLVCGMLAMVRPGKQPPACQARGPRVNKSSAGARPASRQQQTDRCWQRRRPAGCRKRTTRATPISGCVSPDHGTRRGPRSVSTRRGRRRLRPCRRTAGPRRCPRRFDLDPLRALPAHRPGPRQERDHRQLRRSGRKHDRDAIDSTVLVRPGIRRP